MRAMVPIASANEMRNVVSESTGIMNDPSLYASPETQIGAILERKYVGG